jgi:hypothetical protein
MGFNEPPGYEGKMTASEREKPQIQDPDTATEAPNSVEADGGFRSNDIRFFNPWDRRFAADMKSQRSKFDF